MRMRRASRILYESPKVHVSSTDIPGAASLCGRAKANSKTVSKKDFFLSMNRDRCYKCEVRLPISTKSATPSTERE